MRTLKLKAPEPTEAKLQAALIKRLQLGGWLVVRINSGIQKSASGAFFRAYIVAGLVDANGRPACSGFPDVLALRAAPARKADGSGSGFSSGLASSITARLFEVKRLGGVRSEAQERFAAFARARGVAVELVEGLAGLEALTL